MNRTIKRAAVLLTALGLACVPGTAVAHGPNSGPIVVVGHDNQVAGGDIFNAGHSNIVGSGDGGATSEGPGAPAPSAQQTVQIQTSFDRVQLLAQTGDASFAPNLDFNVTSRVTFSERSTATYRGMSTDYDVTLYIDRDSARATCEPTTGSGRCRIEDFGNGPTVIMG